MSGDGRGWVDTVSVPLFAANATSYVAISPLRDGASGEFENAHATPQTSHIRFAFIISHTFPQNKSNKSKRKFMIYLPFTRLLPAYCARACCQKARTTTNARTIRGK